MLVVSTCHANANLVGGCERADGSMTSVPCGPHEVEGPWIWSFMTWCCCDSNL